MSFQLNQLISHLYLFVLASTKLRSHDEDILAFEGAESKYFEFIPHLFFEHSVLTRKTFGSDSEGLVKGKAMWHFMRSVLQASCFRVIKQF